MRLRSKLALAAASSTFAIVLVVSGLFMGELLRQRVSQTAANNEVMVRQVLLMTRQAVQMQLPLNPPEDRTDQAFQDAVADALRSHEPLLDTMDSFVRYSPLVQDVSVVSASGLTLVSTDPTAENQPAQPRVSFARVRDAGVVDQVRLVFGHARVLDESMPLERNGQPFLVIHVGVRSTFLKNNYVPWLKDSLWLTLLCGIATMIATGLLSTLALRPVAEISRRLELIAGEDHEPMPPEQEQDALLRATRTIDRLGVQIKTTTAGYTDLQAGYTDLKQTMSQMLDTLREGVLLFTADKRAVLASDAAANFVQAEAQPIVGREITEIFKSDTALGRAVLEAFEEERSISSGTVLMEDQRIVDFSIDHVDEGRGGRMGSLLTLRDAGSAIKLERELEVSQRLAAIGRLTAGVGHEVKNPINAMVLHLELLRDKLCATPEAMSGASRHVEVLAGEMQRLDRVVQALADFTRPMELHLEEVDLAEIARSVIELAGAEMSEVGVRCQRVGGSVMVRGDADLLRQALLNLVLNGMQAMPNGGVLRVSVTRNGENAELAVADEGSGIAPELIPRLFELYFTTKAKGSGIGLAMTYRIVQMHGGSIEVDSEEGRGSVFTVRLPARLRPAAGSRKYGGLVAAGREG